MNSKASRTGLELLSGWSDMRLLVCIKDKELRTAVKALHISMQYGHGFCVRKNSNGERTECENRGEVE